ncbi:methylated-DNA--[protein]-cysteine S-methyltransferase [Chloroflexota bacterium]
MTEELKYIIFETDRGWVGILASAKGLLVTTLPRRSTREARQLLGNSSSQTIWSPYLFDDLMERLRVYFSGHRATFFDKIDLSGATPFQRKTWETTRLIPYGETRTYLWIAEQIKRPGAVRAVGQALAKNPLPVIVPCHRVISSSGHLGGFSGGVEMKQQLLRLENSVSG